MIQSFLALTLNGFREARRNRVSVVVLVFAVALLLCSALVTEVTIWSMARTLTDFGLGAMSLALVLLAVFLSCATLSKEIERKTIFLVVTRPVSRAEFLLSRFASTALTLLVLLVGMSGVFLLQCKMYGAPIDQPKLAAIAGLYLELLVLSAMGTALSSFSGQVVSSVVAVGVYFAGHLASDIYTLSRRSASAFLRGVGQAVYYALPNLERLDFKAQAAHGVDVPWRVVGLSAAYAVCYAGVLLAIAVLVFRRRDFK